MRGIDVARLALRHLPPDGAVTATAIAKAESNWNPDAIGDVALQDRVWGPSIGLWQIRSYKSQSGTGGVRDATRLGDPAFNARSMAAISRGGTHWTPWSVFKSGSYRTHLPEALSAVRSALQITPEVERIKKWMDFHWAGHWRSLGIYNRRPIRGSSSGRWSQHSWGNALDIGVIGPWEARAPVGTGTDGQKQLDRIYWALVNARNDGTLPIGRIIWRSPLHWDHIHVEGDPERTGTPPTLPSDTEEDEVELIENIQRALVAAGYDLGDFGPDGNGVDGVWGPVTQAALEAAFETGGGPHSHEATVTLS